jgi:mRNA interferase YafQ
MVDKENLGFVVIERTNRFKRDLKLMIKRGKDSDKIKQVILKLASYEVLPPRFRDHALTGDYIGTRECHIEPDWLLIYRFTKQCLYLERTGTHSDLFD